MLGFNFLQFVCSLLSIIYQKDAGLFGDNNCDLDRVMFVDNLENMYILILKYNIICIHDLVFWYYGFKRNFDLLKEGFPHSYGCNLPRHIFTNYSCVSCNFYNFILRLIQDLFINIHSDVYTLRLFKLFSTRLSNSISSKIT